MTTQSEWSMRRIRGYLPAGAKPRVVPITEAQAKDWPSTVYWLGGKYYGVRSGNNTEGKL